MRFYLEKEPTSMGNGKGTLEHTTDADAVSLSEAAGVQGSGGLVPSSFSLIPVDIGIVHRKKLLPALRDLYLRVPESKWEDFRFSQREFFASFINLFAAAAWILVIFSCGW